MNRTLPAEAEVACEQSFAAHAFGVLQIQPGHVDGVDPGGGGGVHHAGAGVEEGLPGDLAAKLRRHVHAAEEERVDAGTGSRDVAGGFETGVGSR